MPVLCIFCLNLIGTTPLSGRESAKLRILLTIIPPWHRDSEIMTAQVTGFVSTAVFEAANSTLNYGCLTILF